jgi:Multiubiquitin
METHVNGDHRSHEYHRHHPPHREHLVAIFVNEQSVKLYGHSATGTEIKMAAIEQGVLIKPNFVLQEELPNGTSRIVGDGDRVHLREHLKFTAITADDNS